VGAEDLLQETWSALYPIWHRVENADSPLAYVRGALAKQYVNSIRRQRKIVASVIGRDQGDGSSGPYDEVIDRDLITRLLASLLR